VLDLVAIRRELHRIPELAFEEHKTSEMLASVVEGLVRGRDDIEVATDRTAIIVHVPATAGPGGGVAGGTADLAGGKTIGWRADMDGLPVAEETGLPYASAHPGVMHACGHDVHMTCGLGILEQILSRPQRNSFVFFFQPAEETSAAPSRSATPGSSTSTASASSTRCTFPPNGTQASSPPGPAPCWPAAAA
jgi:N-acetyldiaminopimelate deacetylase